jgi:outer membrane protein insertion porin family
MKSLLVLLLLVSCATMVSAPSQAEIVKADRIAVSGNYRLEAPTILQYADLQEGREYRYSDLNNAVKRLYQTGYFSEVSLQPNESGLMVVVKENPMINRVVFEGNEKLESKELEGELQLQPRAIYSVAKIQADTARIASLYRRSGRYSAQVTPKLEALDQNRVDVIYEIEEGAVTRIKKIGFVGNEYFDEDTLRKVITTSEGCWYCILSNSDTYDPDRVSYDKELLRRFYTKQGFADFEIKAVDSELSPEKDAFFVTFAIEEGTRYTLGEVAYNSNLPGTDAKELQKMTDTKKGELYNSESVENSIDNMIDALGDKGFAFVDIDPKLQRNKAQKTIDLTYAISEGPRVYIERINIEGNLRTLDEVVRREFRVAEGDPYSTSKLQRSEQRLRNLGFFEDVKVATARGSAPDKVILNVNVEEKSTGEVTFGAGFSTVDGPLADFGIRERNLLGRGQDLRFRGTLAADRSQLDVGFTEPYFMGRDVSAGFDVFHTTQDLRQESSFDRNVTGGRLRFGYALTENLRQDVYYSYQETDVANVDSRASRFIRDQEGVNVTSLIGQSLTYDKLDNRLNPTEGYYLRADLDLAGLGGDSEFIRPEMRAAAYHSFAPKWTMMLRGTGGYVHALNDRIRIQDRFYLGGRDMRGFDNSGIGPRDVTTGDALGGNVYYTGTTELMFPLGLPDDLGFRGAVFVDAGSLTQVDEDGPEVVDEGTLRAAAGVGLAWGSPFGPVRLDFAQAFLKEENDAEETFRFTFGTNF